MAHINTGRALLGGVVAGIIIDVIETAMNGFYLKDDWASAMRALGKSGEIPPLGYIFYIGGGLLTGIIGVWLYSALVSRYGMGSTTAAKAGLVVFALASVIPGLYQLPSGLFPSHLMTMGVVTDFLAILLGVTMGSLLYREEGAPLAQAARA